jgi:hypothetical protein
VVLRLSNLASTDWALDDDGDGGSPPSVLQLNNDEECCGAGRLPYSLEVYFPRVTHAASSASAAARALCLHDFVRRGANVGDALPLVLGRARVRLVAG